jgi:hypothetical protein
VRAVARTIREGVTAVVVVVVAANAACSCCDISSAAVAWTMAMAGAMLVEAMLEAAVAMATVSWEKVGGVAMIEAGVGVDLDLDLNRA